MSRIAQFLHNVTNRLTKQHHFQPLGGSVLRRDYGDKTYLVALAPAHDGQGLVAARHALSAYAHAAGREWAPDPAGDADAAPPEREIFCILLIAAPASVGERDRQALATLTGQEGSATFTVWLADLGNGVLTTDPASVGSELAKAVANAMPREPVPFISYALLGAILGLAVLISAVEWDFNATEEIDVMIRWGAAHRPWLFMAEEPWRFFTANFLHFGAIHLALNSYALYSVGRVVESFYGHWRMLYIFLVAGIAGSVLSAAVGSPVAVSAGASGALFGLIGAVLFFRFSSPMGSRVLLKPLLMTILLNLGIGISLYFIVDNWNHVGGLIGGFFAAWAIGVPAVEGMKRPRFDLPRWGRVAVAGALGLLAVAVPLGLIPVPGLSREVAMALDHLEDGRYAEAEPILRQAVKRQEDAHLYAWLAEAVGRQGQCQEALTLVDKALVEAPGEPSLLGMRAELQRCLGE